MLFPEDQIWMIVVGFIIAFILAFGIGANDVANSFGTSVGSKVLTLRQACVLATICELAGSVLLGSKVSATIRKGIIDTALFAELPNGTATLMAGQVAALGGACVWLLVATFLRLPVSGSHSIVGSIVGFSLVVFGFRAIQWIGIIKIVASWFISPVLSGLTSVAVFCLMKVLVFKKEHRLIPALRMLPGFYGTVVLINVFSIFYDGPPMLYFDRIPLYGIFIISFGSAAITVICVQFLVVPRLKRRLLTRFSPGIATTVDKLEAIENTMVTMVPEEKGEQISIGDQLEMKTVDERKGIDKPKKFKRFILKKKFIEVLRPRGEQENVDEVAKQHASAGNESPSTYGTVPTESGEVEPVDHVVIVPEQEYAAELNPAPVVKKMPVEERVFSFLQIITAVFGSFAHGGNDVSNAIGPLIGLWIIGVTQTIDSKMPTPIWILFYGGVGISIGLWMWGRRVIQTIGEDLSQITPSTGVCIELGSAITVLVASKIGLPISTTHCKVGSVVGVGTAKAREAVNWSLFRNILIAWLVTLPASAAISALLMYLFQFAI